MNVKRGDTPHDTEDERVLRTGLRVSPLSQEAMVRIRAAAEAEWRVNTARPSLRWLRYAAAASVLIMSVLGGLMVMSSHSRQGQGELAAQLVRFEGRGIVEERFLRPGTALVEGAKLRSNHVYRAYGQALVDLQDGGSVRVADGSEFAILARNDVQLLIGEIYVDIPPGARSNSAFVVRTLAGEFRHAGTQFALAVEQGRTRLRVREGRVVWLAPDGESTVQAGTEVVFTRAAKTADRPISASGNEWSWIAKTTPDFEIDDRPLGEFLEWVARESGRRLVLADNRVGKQLQTIRLRGSVHGLTPMQALSAVMATTELHYDLPDGKIRVSFAREMAPRR